MIRTLPILLASLWAIGTVTAQVPSSIPFQGRLTDQGSGTPVNGNVKVTFHLYRSRTGGTAAWSEVQSPVSVTKGLFKTELGSVTGFPPALFDGKTLYLGVQVGTDAEMLPRIAMTSQAYSKLAGNALDVRDRDIHPKTVTIGAKTVIDGLGKWVGDPTGLRGPTGATGPQGPQGLKGDTGPLGPQGIKGDTGAQGLQGLKGDTGPQGVQGIKGDTGAQGLQGLQGLKGDTGPQGVQGLKGDTGAQGLQGLQGLKGDTGPQGVQGLKGDTGPQGIRGLKGDTGPQGVRGLKGDTGPQGIRGLKGDTGPQGVQGLKGDTGPQGASPFGLNGNHAYYTAGRVGIGTNSPVYRLHVIGDTSHTSWFASTRTTGSAWTIHSQHISDYGAAVRGRAMKPTGSAMGVSGDALGPRGIGVHGSASGPDGTGVNCYAGGVNGTALKAYAASKTGLPRGVAAEVRAPSGRGVEGMNTSLTGTGFGVYGAADSDSGRGVYGIARSTQGSPAGVYGEAVAPGGRGVSAYHNNTNGFGPALYAETRSTIGRAIYAIASNTSQLTNHQRFGVYAVSNGRGGDAIYAQNNGRFGAGVRGVAASTLASGVHSAGNFTASGNKSFQQPHPSDPSKLVQFVCLEGNESGTYFRGKTRLVNHRAEIRIPEEWRLVTDPENITVQLTPRGPAMLWVDVQTRDRIVVRGTVDCEFNYFVNGVRRGFAEYAPYAENRSFRPDVRGVPFGTQYPKELRDILVQNGILNPDYTPNEATARRLGWELRNPEDVPVAERYWLASDEMQRLLDRERVSAAPPQQNSVSR